MFIFFNVLPCIYLINDSDFKADMAETKFYFDLLKFFKCEKVDPNLLQREDNDNTEAIQENPENNNQ